ncbi:hypothetical protein T439DRAFT_326981 [Meredithblackwellia eburnea MCA 4105]
MPRVARPKPSLPRRQSAPSSIHTTSNSSRFLNEVEEDDEEDSYSPNDAGSAGDDEDHLPESSNSNSNLNSSRAGGLHGSKVASSSSNSNQTPKKRSRHRKLTSCTPCRQKKRSCNRGAPCNQCSTRNELCVWDDAQPLFNSRAEEEVQALRLHVAHLEGVIQFMTSQQQQQQIHKQPAHQSPHPHVQPLPPAHPLALGLHPHPLQSPHLSPGPHSSPILHPSTSAASFPFPSIVPSLTHHQAEYNPTPPSALLLDVNAHDPCSLLAALARGDTPPISLSQEVGFAASSSSDFPNTRLVGMSLVVEARRYRDERRMRKLAAAVATLNQSSSSKQQQQHLRSPSGSLAASPSSSHSRHNSAPASVHVPQPPPAFQQQQLHQQQQQENCERQPPPLELLDNVWFSISRQPVLDILARLPSDTLAVQCYESFRANIGMISHPLHVPTFEARWSDMRNMIVAGLAEEIDPVFVSIFFCVMAMGGCNLPPDRFLGCHIPGERDTIVDAWLEASVLSLSNGKATENVTIDNVRAGVMLSTFFLYCSPKPRKQLGAAILNIAVQQALTLGFDREPSLTETLPPNSDHAFFLLEDRRRVFWNLCYVSVFASSLLGGAWSGIRLKDVTTKFPLDCSDVDIMSREQAEKAGNTESEISSLLCKMHLAVLVQSINDKVFGVARVPYTTVCELDAELKTLDASLPTCYQLQFDANLRPVRPNIAPTITERRAAMIKMDIAFEFLRLHRPWMALATIDQTYQYSQLQGIKYARMLISLFQSELTENLRWSGLAHKAMSGAIVLAVQTLNELKPGAYDAIRRPLKLFGHYIKAADLHPDIHDSSVAVLQFLQEQDMHSSGLPEVKTDDEEDPPRGLSIGGGEGFARHRERLISSGLPSHPGLVGPIPLDPSRSLW